MAKVCKGGCGNKKAVWIDGGIHARFELVFLPFEDSIYFHTENGFPQPQ